MKGLTGTGPDRFHGGQSATAWRRAGLALSVGLVLVLVCYRETVYYLGTLWSAIGEGPYGHGFVVLAIALFLIYRRRERILAIEPCPDLRALPAVAACMLAWTAAALADVQLVTALCLLPLMLAVTWAIAGAPVTRQLLVPVMFVVFALPVWSPLLPVLREITAASAFFLVRVAGIPALLQEYVVYLPSGQLSINAACSGLHYLLAALTLGTFYALLNYRDLRARLLVILMAACAAILANILRVAVIIYLAYYTEMQHPMVKDHLMLGWYLFGALVVILLVADHRVSRARAVTAGTGTRRAGAGSPVACACSPARRGLLLGGLALLIVSGPLVADWIKSRPAAVPVARPVLPPGQSGWSGPLSPTDDWLPVYHGATELRGDYHRDGVRVMVYVGYYPQQAQGRELINDLNSLDPAGWWQHGEPRRVVSSSGLPVLEAELSSAHGQRRLVWFVYRVGRRYTTSRVAAKVLQVTGLLTGQRAAAVIVLATDTDGDTGKARRGLDDFQSVMEAALARVADGTQVAQGQD